MKYRIIGCRTLENELRAALAVCPAAYDLAWIEAQLHNVPARYRAAVQEIVDGSDGYDAVLLATGFCGNAVEGLQARGTRLVLPRVDDCVSLLLGGVREKRRHLDAYFLTDGWLKGKDNLWVEYQRAVARYGEEEAEEVFRTMLAHYRRMTLLDTGCYDVETCRQAARKIADAFSLELTVTPAGIGYLQRLLAGPWDEDHFLTVAPGERITLDRLQKLSQ